LPGQLARRLDKRQGAARQEGDPVSTTASPPAAGPTPDQASTPAVQSTPAEVEASWAAD
jgi:hypothetical protein